MNITRRDCLQWSSLTAMGLALPGFGSSAARAQEGRKGLALSIALDYRRYDRPSYGNSHIPPLDGCIPDLKDMTKILHGQSLPVRQLINETATRKNVSDWILKAAGLLDAGDLFCVTYSGHGTALRDTSGDEPEDQAWCLYDGLFLDDELANHWAKFKKDVRIAVVSDSCHSGTVLRDVIFNESKSRVINFVTRSLRGSGDPAEVTQRLTRSFPNPVKTRDLNFNPKGEEAKVASASRALPEAARVTLEREFGAEYRRLKAGLSSKREADRATEASVLLLAACQDQQTAADIGTNGLFTAVLKDQIRTATGYRRLLEAIRQRLERGDVAQTPNFMTWGAANSAFEKQSPFSI